MATKKTTKTTTPVKASKKVTAKTEAPAVKTPAKKAPFYSGLASSVRNNWNNLEKKLVLPAPLQKRLGTNHLNRGVLALFAVLIIASLIAFFYGNQLILAWQKQTSAAVVNGETISRSDLEHRLTQTYGDDTVQKMIDETLVLQEGQKEKVNITQDQINSKISDIEKQIAPQKLDDALAQRHLTRTDLDRQVRIQLIVESILGKDIKVSDSDIQNYFDQNKDTLAQEVNKSAADLQLSDVRQMVIDNIKNEMISSKYQTWIEDLRSKATIKTFL